jgi:hypothetical protein
MDSNQLSITQMNTIDMIYKKNYLNEIKYDKSPISNKINKIDTLRQTLMNNMTFNKLDIVEVRNSKIHGKGVFAKRDIKENEILTFYPIDILKLQVDDSTYIASFSNRFLSKHEVKNHDKYEIYQYGMPNGNIIIGCPDFINNNNYIGHMINDISIHNKTKKSIKQYKKNSKKCNCMYYNCSDFDLYVPIVSTKDIRKDEELFTSYGVQYWNNFS